MGGTDDDGAMPPGPWPPPESALPQPQDSPPPPRFSPPALPPPVLPPPPIGSDRSRRRSEWKRPPLGAPLGVWIGVGLFLAVPVLMVVALRLFLEPASDAGFMAFEDDETGFFPFLAALFSIFLLIAAVAGAGIALLAIAIAITIVSGIARKKP